MKAIFDMANSAAPLPKEGVVFDTNALVAIYSTGHPQYKDCYNFSQTLVANNVPIIINPRITEELDHVVTKGIYAREADKVPKGQVGHKNWKTLFEADKSHMPEVTAEVERIAKLIANDPSIVDLPVSYDGKFEKLRRDLFFKYGMGVADSSILALARLDGLNSIATIDKGFGLANNVNLFTSNKKLLALSGPDVSTTNTLIPFDPNGW